MLRDHSQITQCAVCVHMPTHPSVYAVCMDHIIHTWNAAASGVDNSNYLIAYSSITQLLDCSIYTTVLYGVGRAAPFHEKCCQNGALGKYNLSQGCSMCMGWVVWAIYPMLYNRTGWSSQWAGVEVEVVAPCPSSISVSCSTGSTEAKQFQHIPECRDHNMGSPRKKWRRVLVCHIPTRMC